MLISQFWKFREKGMLCAIGISRQLTCRTLLSICYISCLGLKYSQDDTGICQLIYMPICGNNFSLEARSKRKWPEALEMVNWVAILGFVWTILRRSCPLDAIVGQLTVSQGFSTWNKLSPFNCLQIVYVGVCVCMSMCL